MQLKVVSFHFSNRLNCLAVSADRTDCGRRFHTSGPAIEKARLPNFVLQRGTMTSDLAADRICCRPGLLATGATMSLMYSGHLPASALCMSSAILNCIR